MLIKLEGAGPLYQRLYRAIRNQILEGRLRAGERLPSTRGLAQELGVSRNVVMLAFEQLVAEGHLVGHTGSGTYVSSELPEGLRWKSSRRVLPSRLGPATAAPRLSSYGRRLSEADLQLPGRKRERLPYDFRHDLISDSLSETWRRLLAGRARAGRSTSLTYGPEQGHPPLRETLARYRGRNREVLCRANQILITDGSQQAFDLIARVLIDPGDAVALEEPHFIRARQCFRAHGADVVGVPVDAEGLEIRKLSLIVGQPRLVVVTPSHQYPTGVVMPETRRNGLLGWAEQNHALIVEDDYDSGLRDGPRSIEAIQSLDTGDRVLYVGTFSRVLFPSLRIGYVVLPRPLVEPMARAKLLADRQSPTLTQEALTEFIEEGHFERHARKLRERVDTLRKILLDAIDRNLGTDVQVAGNGSGLHGHIWCRHVPEKRAEEGVRAAAKEGVGRRSVSSNYLTPPARAGLILRFGGLGNEEIRVGTKRLGQVIRRFSS